MKVPLSWLKEFIELDLNPEEIAHRLTMAGLEVEGIVETGSDFEGVIVGRVVDSVKHPDADRLSIAKVNDGKEIHQVVCAAPNCRTGITVAYAAVGATLKDEAGRAFKIKKSKLRGVESAGMLCAADELGLGARLEGIMELPDTLPLGKSLSELYGDTVFDIALTPNLSHCTSIMGVARELAALTGKPLRLPPTDVQGGGESCTDLLKVKVKDPEDCPRYACRILRDVKVGPSPQWLKQRLEQCGLRSINNIVDATNYVLLELGHPLHAFDYDKLEGQQIIVRKATPGEKIVTLDGKERILKENQLLIADSKSPAAVAGVMGGAATEVSDATVNIALESAYFNPSSVRRTSKELGLSTDASKRFERGTDPNQVLAALDRAAVLIQLVAGGSCLNGAIDIKAKDFPELVVACRLDRINALLGTSFSRGEVENIFNSLGFQYRWDADRFIVSVPTYRNDIKEEIDLVEEVARLYGYDNFVQEEAPYHSSRLPSSPIYLFEKKVQERLIAEGLQQFLTCDLIGPTLLNIVQDESLAPETVVKVMNPTSVEQSVLRTSLLPGLLQVLKHNIDHQNHHVAGFETGKVHFKDGENYREPAVMGIILSGKARPHNWDIKPHDYDFYDLKGIVENFLRELGIRNLEFKNLGLPTFHTGRQASVFVDSLEIGSIGEVHPAIQRRLDVNQRILFGEFNLHDLMGVAKPVERIRPLPIYPGSERDWTVTIKESVPYHSLLESIVSQASPILEDVQLLDIYRSDKLPAGYQNVTLRFKYRDTSKTIEQETVESVHHRLVTEAAKRLQDSVIV